MNFNPITVNIEQIAVCSYSIPGFVDFMTSNENYIWITNPSQNTVQCFNRSQPTPFYETHVPQAVGVPVYAFSAVWVASLQQRAIYKIAPETGAVLAIIATGLGDLSGEFSLAASPEGIWVVCGEGQLCMIEPASCEITHTLQIAPHSYNLSYGDDALWLSNQYHDSVQRINPLTLRITHQIQVDKKPVFLAFGEHAIWTLNQTHGTVSKIDPVLKCVVATIQLPEQAKGDGGDICVSHGKVWIRTTHMLLIQVDCQTLKIEKVYQHDIPAGSGAVCPQHNLLWISAHDIDKLWAVPLSHDVN
ncbi:hypothetical protein F4V57_10185 [Acinetobacter qingfengensis]|uniref:SMP-30/gluconolactonase/LRE family protein n=1 Tax=Acinetobacter qingfengensis TaxID=1262585 RepID=A0A1E7R537_9GAMM|nr:hypothetical protein [Acinetobacter qingfengensis]KAA8732428.1 hypothetical protein F4V57_10185 [Acinetobacter qingfengensis]OEY94422.1 hypothetical protein BJI46_03520 [Acinetobacter qingfengensis]